MIGFLIDILIKQKFFFGMGESLALLLVCKYML